MGSIGHLMEVILYVEDMNAQVAFYRDRLGLAVTFPQDVQDFANQYWVTLATGTCTLVLHGGGKGRTGVDAPKIVFGVADIQAARAELLSRGVAISAVREAAPGVLVCDAADPEGNKFSIESHEDAR